MKLTCEFDRAQYLTGQEIRLYLPEGVNAPRVCVYRLETPVDCSVRQSGRSLILPPLPIGSYGVAVEAGSAQWEGAFDVVEDSRQVTRYAFLSDFTSADTETQDVDWLRRLHFNAVQFYDWMYRHDMLLPPQERYLDPMGRETDLAAIRAKIAACKAAGIRPIAYGAVYAAAKELFAAHPEWAMYTMDGQAMTFAGWLYYMNIAPDCGWSEHILAEFRKAVAFGFSGIHMDTYGFPKQVWDAERRPVELTDALPKLIDRAAEAVRKEDSAAGVIFNAVNNWPMESVAGTTQDAVYIEVWPPNDRYQKAACDYYYAHFTHPDMHRAADDRQAMALLAEKRRQSLVGYNLDACDPTAPETCLPKQFHLTGGEFKAQLHAAVECYDSREDDYKRRASALLHSFLLQTAHEHLLARNSAQGRKIRKSDVIAEQLLRYLNQNYTKHLTSREIEELFEGNFDYLNRVFSSLTGSPVFAYLNILRINNAKQLISTTDLPFSEIAYLVGIEDRYYFSKLFRKMTGMSPTEYYKEVRS